MNASDQLEIEFDASAADDMPEIIVELPLGGYINDLAAARADGRDDAEADVAKLADTVATLAGCVAMLVPKSTQPTASAKTEPIARVFDISPDELVRLGGVSKALARVRGDKS